MSQFVRRHQLPVYFAIAYLVSWALLLPAVATVQGWWQVDVPKWWHYTAAAGPITAAFTVTALTGGGEGIRRLLTRYSPRRVPAGWLAFVVGSLAVMVSLGLVATRIADGRWLSLDDLSRTDNLPDLGFLLTLVVQVFTFGLGEETGWRGFALPRLQSHFTAIHAADVLFLLWACWHLPMFFENPSFMEFGAFQIVGWLFGLWLGSIFLAWLYNSSRGSLVVVLLWHGGFNLFSASEASDWVPALLSFGVIVMAIVAIRLAGPEELTGWRRSPANRRQRFA